MISTAAELKQLMARAAECERVAVDTEFVWERTYYPCLGVVQVALAPDDCHLIDIPAIDDLSSLGELLANPSVCKILHDCVQDLTILYLATGAKPRNIYDSRLAAGFAGLDGTISLANLLLEVSGVDLPKTESRTDWLRRPLSEAQVEYALDDVRYLHETCARLDAMIAERGTAVCLAEDFAALDNPDIYDERPATEQFRRIRGGRRLKPRQQAILRELAIWREEVARAENRPQGHVVNDKILIDLCFKKTCTAAEMQKVKGLSRQAREMYGSDLLAAIERGLALPEEECPQPLEHHDADKETKALASEYLEKIACACEERGIDPCLCASRAEVTALICAQPDVDPAEHRLLQGWRREIMDACSIVEDKEGA